MINLTILTNFTVFIKLIIMIDFTILLLIWYH